MGGRSVGAPVGMVATGLLAVLAVSLLVWHVDRAPAALETGRGPRATAEAPQPGPTRPGCGVSADLVPACGLWWGVAPSELTGVPRREALRQFESDVGRPVDVYHAYHRDAALFPTAEEVSLARDPQARRLLLLNWKPSTTASWRAVADGAVDDRLDALARHITATFPERFFLTIWHEPENDVVPAPGSGMTARDYADMYRHVVTGLRERGVTNAVTVMTYMGSPEWGVAPWFPELYPGDDVVDWIGVDPYIYAVPRGNIDGGFRDIVDRKGPGWPGFYTWAQSTFPDKPIMVGEWGVFHSEERPERKAWVFRTVSRDIHRFPAIKALIYYDSPRAPKGDTRIDSTRESLQEFRDLGTLPWLVAPTVPPR